MKDGGTPVDHPKPWLKYIEADKIQDRTLALDGMKVRNNSGEKLGTVDGLIVDGDSGRTYYMVVDAPGWFSSKQFLLPIGQTHLDEAHDGLIVNLSKDQVQRFPGFDKDEFDKLSETDIKRINDDIGMVLEPTASYETDEPYYEAWNREFFQYPDWWEGMPIVPAEPVSSAVSSLHETTLRRERSQSVAPAEVHDTSPHLDGRAQPGDVLGIETGGEETHIGETKEDEDERRRKAVESDRKNRT
jgi:sporulation protein YlmC with PRC-barrel domain